VDFIRINNPLDVSWYHTLLDLTLLTCLIMAVAYSVRALRRGRRDYALLLVTGFFYGLLTELSGMIWHHSYTQGEFVVMLDFTKFELFAQSTAMPAYVPILYPTMLFLAYKLIESLGIVRPWQRALAGGVVMALIDAPYAIQGGLPHVVWWTWRPWEMYQFWMDWPLLDLWWRLTWDSVIFWIVYRSTPLVDFWYAKPGSSPLAAHLKALLVLPLCIAVVVNVVGPVLHLPGAIPTMFGVQQAPLVTLLGVIVAAVFLLAEKRPRPEVDGITVTTVSVFLASMTAMVVGNIVHEGRFTDYILVESVAIAILVVVLIAAQVTSRHHRSSRVPGQQEDIAATVASGTPQR
jgi:hypothetical protein